MQMDEQIHDRTDHRMRRPGPWVPWAMTSIALLAAAALAFVYGGYWNGAAADGAQPWRAHHYHGGGIWVFFLLFWIFGGIRWMWGGWYRSGPWHYRRCYRPYDDYERDEWEAWHRRAHERMEHSRRPDAAGAPEASHPPLT